jgi:F-type H+-transporting ATPase subunit a
MSRIFPDMTALFQSRSSSIAIAMRFLACIALLLAVFVPSLGAQTPAPHNPALPGAVGAPTAIEQHTAAPGPNSAADAHVPGAAHEGEHHALPAKAPTFGGSFINNSMIVTWIVAAGVILFAQFATRRIRSTKEAALHTPAGAQNFAEFLVEGLRNFLEEIIGRDLTKKTFWFFATVFIFILFTNWFGLMPGVGTIGWGHHNAHGDFVVVTPLLRGGNADLNMTFAMSAIFFVCWVVWALQANGAGGFVKHLFAPKGEATGGMKVLLIVVFLAVGVLEVISIAFRPVSLSFRLYGNIFAGENLLESMQNVVPALGWLTPLPFYFMELLVGLVQALVFMLLTAVFTLLICTHDEEHGEHGHGGPHDEPDPDKAHGKPATAAVH